MKKGIWILSALLVLAAGVQAGPPDERPHPPQDHPGRGHGAQGDSEEAPGENQAEESEQWILYVILNDAQSPDLVPTLKHIQSIANALDNVSFQPVPLASADAEGEEGCEWLLLGFSLQPPGADPVVDVGCLVDKVEDLIEDVPESVFPGEAPWSGPF